MSVLWLGQPMAIGFSSDSDEDHSPVIMQHRLKPFRPDIDTHALET